VAQPEEERPGLPGWWYVVVFIAAVLAVLWFISAVIGFLFGLVRIAVVVILAIALLGYFVNRKADR